MTDTPLKDAVLKKLDEIPEDEFRAGVVVVKDDYGGVIEYRRDIGKPGGWSVSAAAEWWRRAGYRAAALVKWEAKK